MKFGKRLKQQIRESLPEWRDKFLTYKDLKQQVNLISSTPMMSINGISESQKAEANFIHSLNIQINKFNSFFMEQEEDFIIRHPELQQRILRVILTLGPNGSRPSETIYREQMEMIKKDIVNFHGKMVLLVNYSNINYIGLAKILKKYDKRTGAVLRSPFIQKVLQQPFFTTDLVSKLIKECESTIDAVFQTVDKDAEKEVRRAEIETTTMKGQSIFSNTVAALVTMQEIRRWSSTYSQFSLPPLNLPDSDLIQSFKFNSPIPTP